jgi:hypothetical protein
LYFCSSTAVSILSMQIRFPTCPSKLRSFVTRQSTIMPIPVSTRSVFSAPRTLGYYIPSRPDGSFSDFSERTRLLLFGAPRWLRSAHSPIRPSSMRSGSTRTGTGTGTTPSPSSSHARVLRLSRKALRTTRD